MRERGTVKWFSGPKGFGFISRHTGEDIFVHYSEIAGTGYRMLQDGEIVEFTLHKGLKGYQALNVAKVEAQ